MLFGGDASIKETGELDGECAARALAGVWGGAFSGVEEKKGKGKKCICIAPLL